MGAGTGAVEGGGAWATCCAGAVACCAGGFVVPSEFRVPLDCGGGGALARCWGGRGSRLARFASGKRERGGYKESG